MSDLPISHTTPASSTGKIAAAFARLIARFGAALAQASARNAQRKAMRRTPDEILMAHARREEARREVDKLLLLR